MEVRDDRDMYNGYPRPDGVAYRELPDKEMMSCDYGTSEYHFCRIAFDWSSDYGALAKACIYPKDVCHSFKGLSAVYVIGGYDADYCKIGLTNRPLERLDNLQTSNWDTLCLHYVLYVWNEKAKAVEGASHKLAREVGYEVRREWVGVRPEQAFRLVIESAAALGVEASDARSVDQTARESHAARIHRIETMKVLHKAERSRRQGYSV